MTSSASSDEPESQDLESDDFGAYDSESHESLLRNRQAGRPNRPFVNESSKLATLTRRVLPLVGGGLVTLAFYGLVSVADQAFLNRYFLGHPVAYAATFLFAVALAILLTKTLEVAWHQARVRHVTDDHLLPAEVLSAASATGANAASLEDWRHANDAGFVARQWLGFLAELPTAVRFNLLLRRLTEVLGRQSNRGTSKHLSDDLRELAVRDADAAHDSFGLVRIIVWAIPMLGFLGTVIGITQTLGGLDFSDGTAAVDRLKSGLYVAFDTTALGLVLSVVAIFLQFPVERAEQALLADIDARTSELVLRVLPSDDPGDHQATLITQLCDGIRAAVGESLSTQASLWQATIAEAQAAWRDQHDAGTERFRQLMVEAFSPVMDQNADQVARTARQLDSVAASIDQSLVSHAKGWNEILDQTGRELQTHRRTLMTHTEAMTALATQQVDLVTKQESALEDQRNEDVRHIDHDRKQMTAAMKTLANAVQILSSRLSDDIRDADAVMPRQRAA
ncbi:MAG: MotA/TolQ/ExbB proton channel family protein [Planctomycetota bacterium]